MEDRQLGEQRLSDEFSEMELRQLVDAIPQQIFVLTSDGDVLYVNQVLLEYYRLTLPEIKARDVRARLVHPDDLQGISDEFERGLSGGVPFEMEGRFRRHDAQYRWFLVRTVPLRDELGSIVKWFSAGHDIEDRRRVESELRRSEAHLAEAQKLSHTGSWVYNVLRDEIIHWSAEMYRIWRLDSEKGVPSVQIIRDRIHPDDVTKVFEAGERAIRRGIDQEVDFRIVLPDGSLRYVHLVGHPAVVVSGKVIETTGTVMDITEQHEAGAALEQAFDEIKKLKDQLYKENLALKAEIDRSWMFDEIVGGSPALQGVLARVSKVAPTDSTVLLTGETGTGKELIAHAIHTQSRRSSRAFVGLNCAAIPAPLIASELFGHEKGAFTGATQRRLGRFELADGGTVFLDE